MGISEQSGSSRNPMTPMPGKCPLMQAWRPITQKEHSMQMEIHFIECSDQFSRHMPAFLSVTAAEASPVPAVMASMMAAAALGAAAPIVLSAAIVAVTVIVLIAVLVAAWNRCICVYRSGRQSQGCCQQDCRPTFHPITSLMNFRKFFYHQYNTVYRKYNTA